MEWGMAWNRIKDFVCNSRGQKRTSQKAERVVKRMAINDSSNNRITKKESHNYALLKRLIMLII